MKFFPMPVAFLLSVALAAVPAKAGGGGQEIDPSLEEDHRVIRGMTISCQTWGWEWGTEGFGEQLDRLRVLGVNWIAIHPYATIAADGGVRSMGGELDPARPPEWIRGPIAAAHSRGLSILIKPHLAYWGSPFAWRGDIEFAEGPKRERFWLQYGDWIERLADLAGAADGFCVGTELDRMLDDEPEWRALIARVRARTPARLTYAANWDHFGDVPFWDELDAIGVQAYFPLSDRDQPSDEQLRRGWQGVLAPLRELHRRSGKPVVFTELGYDAAGWAAREPWRSGRGAAHGAGRDAAPRTDEERALQARLLGLSLEVLETEREWLRGAFLWKWFVGVPGHNDHSFYLDLPHLRGAIGQVWR